MASEAEITARQFQQEDGWVLPSQSVPAVAVTKNLSASPLRFLLVALTLAATSLTGCLVPSDPYPGAYLIWDGSRLTLKTVPCLHVEGGFDSVQLDKDADRGGYTILWRLEKISGRSGVDSAPIGGSIDGYRTVVPLSSTMTDGTRYEANFDNRIATTIAFQLEDVTATGFYSPAADSEAQLLEMPPTSFGCQP